ncbi:hypothetical protein FE249_15970 [Acidiphilium multivorum]|uniref:hypothetical protein n=1 Tax=Acidiphilium multivorum TaxID=62140 RepID=UPI001F4C0DA8|nr:hypothetical protein [Acidiphilium multivorum]UNC15609.1 hypothetical protein FE249_15970 [Acidiphilium multivorum]
MTADEIAKLRRTAENPLARPSERVEARRRRIDCICASQIRNLRWKNFHNDRHGSNLLRVRFEIYGIQVDENLSPCSSKWMPSPILYSVNPWISVDITERYRGKKFFCWVSEFFDATSAATSSAASLIAPSSSPQRIYRTLQEDCNHEDRHSALIKGYKKTFRRLAREWLSDGSLNRDQHDEIVASITGNSWRIWRPVLYVIPTHCVHGTARLRSVPNTSRAAYGPEMQIKDLERTEFDIIELKIS